MRCEVGTTCAFTFTARFATLNGVYRVRAETMFADAFATQQIDFVKNLYTPAGLSQTDFNADYQSYLNDMVAVLESVADSNVVYYVPESVFLTFPDPTVREFFPLQMVIDLGVQKNTQTILPLLEDIKDRVQAATGNADGVKIFTNSQRKVYLTDDQYTVLEAARSAQITALTPLTVQLRQAEAQIRYLAARCQAYEDLIKTLSPLP